MSVFEQYLFESSTVNGLLSSTNESAGVGNATPQDGVGYNEEEGSVGADMSVSSYRDRLEGMIVGILQAPVVSDEGEDSSFGDQTILSSTASDMVVEGYDYQSAMQTASPSATRPLSVSTASSRFMVVDDQDQDQAAISANQASLASLSFQSSLLDSSFTLTPLAPVSLDLQNAPHQTLTSVREDQQHIIGLEARREPPPPWLTALTFPFHNANNVTEGNVTWFSHFTDKDWAEFRRRANMVVRSLRMTSPSFASRSHRLPPMPPALHIVSTDECGELDVSSFLSTSFICPLCQDGIVGALTLDCECGTNVCAACWEYRSVTKDPQDSLFDLASEWGYTIISFHESSNSHQKCPCCSQLVRSPLSCHALDVAILQVVQSLCGNYGSFQHAYYQRLKQWRDEIARRQLELASKEESCCGDEHMVAQLILEEEERIWQKKKESLTRKGWAVPGTVSMVAALVASIAIKLLTQNHHSRGQA